MFSRLLKTNTIIFFISLSFAIFIVLLAKKTLLENETVAYQILQESGQFSMFELFNGIQYIGIPIYMAFKITLISFTLWVGAFMFGYKLFYSSMWKIAMVGEVLFVFAEFIKIFWLIFIDAELSIHDIQNFYPLSAINLVDYHTLNENWIYPLKAFNLFEVAYWLVLVEAIHDTARKKKDYAYAIVFTSYVPLFFIWLFFYAAIYK